MADSSGKDQQPPIYQLVLRSQAEQKLSDIKDYIDQQRGNEPGDTKGLEVVVEIIKGIAFIQRWPFYGRIVKEAGESYRQRKVGKSYLAYYYINTDTQTIYVIDIRHKNQAPLKGSTLRKYRSDMDKS